MRRSPIGPRRRNRSFRRLFYFGLGPAALALVGSPAEAAPALLQETPSPRLDAREIRVTRARSGEYRVLEIIDFVPGSHREGPQALLRLPAAATSFSGTGADIERADLLLQDSTLSILRWPADADRVQLAVSYQLPPSQSVLGFASPLPTAELGVSVARGSVHARIDPRLEAAGEVGSAARPRRRFVASDLPPETAVALRLGSQVIGWRERIVVLLATAAAVTLAAVWVLRS